MNDASGPIMTIFRSRLRPDAEANGYSELAARMEARARAMPGFVDFKTFTALDGERVSIVVFDTLEHQNAWRDDPQHRAAQLRGRESFYQELLDIGLPTAKAPAFPSRRVRSAPLRLRAVWEEAPSGARIGS